jgi:hypothetical protein
MLMNTGISVQPELLENLSYDDFLKMKNTLNEPTGNFFYDSWQIKDEYKNTVWDKLLKMLPDRIGEARLIILESETCYTKHCDIDDRYHLNLHGDCAYLLDLEKNHMHQTVRDYQWYQMDTGVLHSAASFGEHKRIQLVVRKLLEPATLCNPVLINIRVAGENPRYQFDNTLSSWLNRANKKKIINNFKILENESGVSFNIETNYVKKLKTVLPQEFILEEII